MPQVLVRALPAAVVERLKARAERNGRSLEAELRAILERAAAEQSMEEFRAVAARIRRSLEGRQHSDSALLVAEDRER